MAQSGRWDCKKLQEWRNGRTLIKYQSVTLFIDWSILKMDSFSVGIRVVLGSGEGRSDGDATWSGQWRMLYCNEIFRRITGGVKKSTGEMYAVRRLKRNKTPCVHVANACPPRTCQGMRSGYSRALPNYGLIFYGCPDRVIIMRIGTELIQMKNDDLYLRRILNSRDAKSRIDSLSFSRELPLNI